MMALRAYEFLDRRILAAIRFEDALGRPVRSPVQVQGAGVAILRKPTGEVVVTAAPGLAAHEANFASPPAVPAIGSLAVALDVRPAARELAPRRAVLQLPRDPDPGATDSVLRPAVITLLPSVLARVSGLAAAVLATVRRADDGRRVEGALVRLRPEGAAETRAVTNAAGEALLLAGAIPLTSPGPGATVLPHTAAEIDVVVVPARARFHDPADAAAMQAARRAEAERSADFPDPDAFGGAGAAAAALRISPGRMADITLDWTP